MVYVGAYAIYLTIAEQRRSYRAELPVRIARAGAGLIALILGVLASLSALGIIFKVPAH